MIAALCEGNIVIPKLIVLSIDYFNFHLYKITKYGNISAKTEKKPSASGFY